MLSQPSQVRAQQLINQFNLQKNLLMSGLILMSSSLGYYFLHEGLIGNLMRYGALAGGFGLIMLSCIVAPIQHFATKIKVLGFGTGTIVIFFLLGAIKPFEELSMQQLAFQIVCYFLFVAGVLLYNDQSRKHSFKPSWYFWIIYGMSMAGLLMFTLFVGSLTGWDAGATRGFGHLEELNPIGVAYTQICLTMVFLGGIIACKGFLGKIGFSFGIILTLANAIITGSRGPAIFAVFTFALLALLYLRNNFTYKRLLWMLGTTIFLAVSLTLAVLHVEFIQDRFYLLLERFRLITEADTLYSSTGMFAGRLELWYSYLYQCENWFLTGNPKYNPYPHNFFVEFFARFGLYGFVVSMVILYVLIRFLYLSLIRKGNLDSCDYLYVGMFVYCFLQSQTSMSLDINRLLWIGTGYVAMYAFSLSGSKKPPTHQSTNNSTPHSAQPVSQLKARIPE